MAESASVLVVAFDGLDIELVEKFDLDVIKQAEYGTIDNETDIKEIKTSELFASFITGETYEEHGITGITRWNKPARGQIVDIAAPNLLKNNLRGFTRLEDTLKSLLGVKRIHPEKEELKVASLFEEIDNSKDMFVPGYDNSIMKETGAIRTPMEYGYFGEELKEYYDSREYDFRKRKLMREVNKWFDFLMCHFQRVDYHQHTYGDKNVSYDEEMLEEIYQETESLAQRIIDFFEDDYEYIIFMSDHGLPTKEGHNENAFYSCNKKLFGDKNPHITDFHDKILEIVQ
jgi:predicted AlkP superfamily pyrophosphatase or phosphodiesterase